MQLGAACNGSVEHILLPEEFIGDVGLPNGLTGARARLGVREHTAHALTGLRLHDDTSRHVPRLLPISTRFLRLLAHAH